MPKFLLSYHARRAVSAISVGPRPITSPTGRHVFEVVGPAVRQLHLIGGWSWWKEIMGCGVSTENIGCPIMCLSSNIDVLIRCRSRFSCCSRHCHSGRHDIVIVTYRTTTTVLYDVGRPECRYRHLPPGLDTNITRTKPLIMVPWHWCTKRLQV